MEWIYIIAIGFICVMYPIALLICVFLMPWYVILAYFIWITISIILISLSIFLLVKYVQAYKVHLWDIK